MSRRVLQLLLSGSVQGCGIRPALTRLATTRGWSGQVKNTTAGVELTLAGYLPVDDELLSIVRMSLPIQAATVEIRLIPLSHFEGVGFCIQPSETFGPVSAVIPCDVAICAECLAEVRDPSNRRYRYPLTSCSRCGPRYSILLKMPFDRERTTLRSFQLCAECQREYDCPSDRRFHAQTIGCPNCGPNLWLTAEDHVPIGINDDAVRQAAETLMDGKIVALRGIGGYQLLVDATSSVAVTRLRLRKQRPHKPFAVLCRTLDDARQVAAVDELEAQTLASGQNPIVLLQQRAASFIAAEVNPCLREIGVMLPTTAMHDRLLELMQRPLVCTSANVHDEPLVHSVTKAEAQLKEIADLFLHHNREIQHPIDDSVVRVMANRVAMIRCARGYAPMPLALPPTMARVAVGGHQKAALAVSNGHQAWLGPHICDLHSLVSQEEWYDRLQQLTQLVEVTLNVTDQHTSSSVTHAPTRTIQQFVCDRHPGYFSTQASEQFDGSRTLVWHHHAHVLAAMVEHKVQDEAVLGVAFDGSGLGTDGTIWGGEFLIASTRGFQRVGHLRRFGLPGGEAAIKDVRRLAVSLLSQLESLSADEIAGLTRLAESDVLILQKILRLPQSPLTSSAGRLFDAVASLILGVDRPTYEGQAAMMLEAACDVSESGSYQIDLTSAECVELDWRPMLQQIVEDRRTGVPVSSMAARFHRGISRAIISICERWSDLSVVLCGGVFQNRVLIELIANSWPDKRRRLGLPGLIPVNDGGLAAGQLAALTVQ